MIGDDQVPKLKAGDAITQSFLEKLLGKVNRQTLQPGAFSNGQFSLQRQIGQNAADGGSLTVGMALITVEVTPAIHSGNNLQLGIGRAVAFINNDPNPLIYHADDESPDSFDIYNRKVIPFETGTIAFYVTIDGKRIVVDGDCG